MNLDVTHLAGPLWIGSHPSVPGHRCGDHRREVALDALAHNGFEVLVLCAEEWQPSAEHFPGVEVIYAPFDDDHSGPLPPRQQRIAFDAAQKTAEALTAGKKTLVTCWAGRNRSGLVSALALASVSGEHPAAAGDMIRDVRDGALTNMQFLSLLSRAQLKKTCELCEAKPITQRYHEDALCWIADCAQCGVPMAVYREHGTMPPPEHLDHMLETLKRCGRPRRGGHRFDDSMNTIPDHYHVHLRPA